MVSRFCRVVESGGRIVAGVHVTEITIGGVGEAALLGPIAVDADLRSVGYGKMLIAEAIDALKRGGVRVVILVGDEPYYGRFGFKPAPRGQIVFPGPVNPDRLLALELAAGALADYCGLVVASPQPR